VDVTGQALTTDHIIPTAASGATTFPNLCRACRSCNEAKGEQTHAVDPFTGETVPLYHPRQQPWVDHFAWDETGIRLLGLTAIGRATIVALDMNNGLAALGECWLASAPNTIRLKFTAPASPHAAYQKAKVSASALLMMLLGSMTPRTPLIN
jgi:hypothetical protein